MDGIDGVRMCGKDKKERREKRMEGVSMDKAVDLPIH
jgi:hypothetical protein